VKARVSPAPKAPLQSPAIDRLTWSADFNTPLYASEEFLYSD